MATRLIYQGRSYDFGKGPELSSEPLPLPLQGVVPLDPNYVDGPWGIRYRKIDRALPQLHWLTMPELMKLLGQNEAWIAGKVRDGELDAAVVRGSSIPLFRILDRAAIVAEALVKTPEKSKKTRPARERWDK